MTLPAILTTSWDDGHPLDHKLADLLDRYGILGTFYIPRQSQLPTLSEPEIASLSQRHEIGGHTLDHLALTTLSNEAANRQISDCQKWVTDVTGQPCLMFVRRWVSSTPDTRSASSKPGTLVFGALNCYKRAIHNRCQ